MDSEKAMLAALRTEVMTFATILDRDGLLRAVFVLQRCYAQHICFLGGQDRTEKRKHKVVLCIKQFGWSVLPLLYSPSSLGHPLLGNLLLLLLLLLLPLLFVCQLLLHNGFWPLPWMSSNGGTTKGGSV